MAQQLARWTIEVDTRRDVPPDLFEMLSREAALLPFSLEEYAQNWLRRRDHPSVVRIRYREESDG